MSKTEVDLQTFSKSIPTNKYGGETHFRYAEACGTKCRKHCPLVQNAIFASYSVSSESPIRPFPASRNAKLLTGCQQEDSCRSLLTGRSLYHTFLVRFDIGETWRRTGAAPSPAVAASQHRAGFGPEANRRTGRVLGASSDATPRRRIGVTRGPGVLWSQSPSPGDGRRTPKCRRRIAGRPYALKYACGATAQK